MTNSNGFFNYPLVWGIIFLISFLYVHNIWLNPYYNNQRVIHKLTNNKRKNINFKINTDNKIEKSFKKKRIFRLLLASFIVTLIITAFNYYIAKDKIIDDFYGIIELSIPICISYLTFSMFVRKDDCEKDDSLSIYNILPRFIDEKLILPLIELEKEFYIECIYEKIKEWYKQDYNNVFFCALIMRISGKNFTSMMNIRDEEDSYKDDAIYIINQYVEGDKGISVLTALKELISRYLNDEDINLYKFIEFISEHEENCAHKDKYNIHNEMRSITSNLDFDNEEIQEESIDDIMKNLREKSV